MFLQKISGKNTCKKAESWKSGNATEERGWAARGGDAVLEARLLESGRRGGLLGAL